MTYYMTGGDMNGKSALPDLAKKISGEDDWKNLPIEEQERLLQQLWDNKEGKKAVNLPSSFRK